ncbi:hypothetical protein HanPSC8_Chr09g0377731 [Helianthus annuus]|nr:hypothetical protein HanPSC8_Chr09g0377731 [Helianthus annuus]
MNGKEKLEALRREMMSAAPFSAASSDSKSDFLDDVVTEEYDNIVEEIIEEEKDFSCSSVEDVGKMAEVDYLSALVKSLARDEDERREAVGLLSTLSDVSAVRRRIGRIQGCIVMLVAIFNGEDQTASDDAGSCWPLYQAIPKMHFIWQKLVISSH